MMVDMHTDMIKIQTKNDHKDFIDFLNDPEVKVLSVEDISEGKVYTFNTDEQILVPKKFIDVDERGDLDDIIFGKDKTTNVVSIHVDDDHLYIYREVDGEIECEVRENLFWIVSPKKFSGFERLKGSGYYKYVHRFSERSAFEEARKIGYRHNWWSISNSEESTLIDQGITFFKGMKVEDVSVLSFDIEGSGLVRDDTSQVFCISNTFRKNGKITKRFFSVDDYSDDAHMIDAWCDWVQEINPTVLTGHNIFGYDLPYLDHCSDGLFLGRDGSAIRFNDYTSKFRKDGSQSLDYVNATIVGREIVDTMFLSYKYDFKREFPSYGLKPIIKHLDLEAPDRQHYDAALIAQNWSDPVEREKIKAYAEDDADDALALYDIMVPPLFYYSQSIPKTFQQVVNSATGAQINAFMVRSYFQEGYSLPKASPSAEYEGAVSMGIPGVYENVRKVDVASLYPSIMIQYEVYDANKDPKRYFLDTVKYFTEQRLKNKKLGKETGEKYYKDLEQAQKIVINSMYGFLGTAGLLFNSPKKAAFVTKKGREILLKGVECFTGHTLEHAVKEIKNEGKPNEEKKYHWILGPKVCEGLGYNLVNVDTDSFSYTDGNSVDDNLFSEEIVYLNAQYPENINWENDGVYDQFIVVAAKNYVTVKRGETKVKYKGSSLKDQKKEPALSELLKHSLNAILTGTPELCVTLYNRYCKEALNINDITRWSVKKTITEAVMNATTKAGEKLLDAVANEHVNLGDKVWVYNAIDGEIQKVQKGEPVFYKDGTPNMIPNEILKLNKNWDNDENKWHYVKRCYQTMCILENILDISKFEKYHNKTKRHLLLDEKS